jgi:hypothetical protein
MRGPAPRGRRKVTRTPDAGLMTALKRLWFMPDPAGLSALAGNNAPQLRVVAKLVHALCDGRTGTRFYLGSVSLAAALGTHQRTAHRWLQQLERRAVIRRVWTGRRVRRGETGEPVPGGSADRATEYVYIGLPATL